MVTLERDLSASQINEFLVGMGRQARAAAGFLRASSALERSRALRAMAQSLRDARSTILAANEIDQIGARDHQISPAMLDRLALDPNRVDAMARGLEDIAALPDPVGRILHEWQGPQGLAFQKVSVPIGVIGMIFEARPNVVSDAAGLCLRAGNSVILRAGSEALASAQAIHKALETGLKAADFPAQCVQLVPFADRAAVGSMLQGLQGGLDLLIPRGGKALVARVQAEARVAVLSHLDGICHTYVHRAADRWRAIDIVANGKMRRTGVCGATECLLIDQDCADELLPAIAQKLLDLGCELRGDAYAREIVPAIGTAQETDWGCEFLGPILAIRVVDHMDRALEHIARFGSGHTDAIVTENAEAAARFLAEVDSAIVLHNASTQFADGGEFGFGAEIGIATGRLHARGPVGAAELTTYKYVVRGEGHIRP